VVTECTEVFSPPQAIAANRRLPQLDRAVLTARSIKLAIRAETSRPYRSVVSLARLDLLLRIVIPNMHPSIRRTSRDESPRSAVQRNRCHLAVCLDMAEQMTWLRSREEVDVLARSHGNSTVRVVVQASVELT
jgi:hypothetical protein